MVKVIATYTCDYRPMTIPTIQKALIDNLAPIKISQIPFKCNPNSTFLFFIFFQICLRATWIFLIISLLNKFVIGKCHFLPYFQVILHIHFSFHFHTRVNHHKHLWWYTNIFGVKLVNNRTDKSDEDLQHRGHWRLLWTKHLPNKAISYNTDVITNLSAS